VTTPKMTAGQFRKPLGDLSSRSVRVGLLAWTYEDAVISSKEPDGHSASFGSRALTFNEDLWRRGSYHEFQAELERLRQTSRASHYEFWQAFIRCNREPNHDARAALATITGLMPKFIYVPSEVSEARGYLPRDAAMYQRKTRAVRG
jgi:hypothetical protein